MPRWAAQIAFAAVLGATWLGTSPAGAQEWARKMFNKLDHNFEVVARGSDTVYRFEVKNIYKEDVVLESVRSSCGCTSPSIENRDLKTYQTGYIVAKFNTRTFTGPHSATLTVKLEFQDASGARRPGQVQLRVHGTIRGDIVFEPGSIDFANVPQGSQSERTISVSHAGRGGWRIEDVRSVSGYLEAELVERRRDSRRVSYDLLVRLKENAPPGFLKQQLVIFTNDSSNPRIPIDVAGKVEAEVTVSPENLALGDVPQGETVTKRLIVKGKKPFRITEVACGDDGFAFETDETTAATHLVTVTYTANREPGRLRKPITIATDLGETYKATCQAYARVVEAKPDTAQAASEEAAAADRTASTR